MYLRNIFNICLFTLIGAFPLRGSDFEILNLFEPALIQETKDIFNESATQYKKTGTVPFNIRESDPSQGREDCEEQAVVLHDLLRQGKLFDELEEEDQEYLFLRHLFKKVDQRDIFGMVVQRDESYFIKRLDPEIALALRHKISQYVDMYMKKLAKELLPNNCMDSCFDLLPIGKFNLPRISTTGGILILFAYAKKYQVPVMLRVKCMEALENGLKGQGEAFLAYVYNPKTKMFEYSRRINQDAPIFCIRCFSIADPKQSLQKIPADKSTQKMAMFFNNLKSATDFKSYIEILKKIDLKDLMLLLAAREDYAHKRPMEDSSFFKKYQQVANFFNENEEYTTKDGQYTKEPKAIAIRHIYVSSFNQQQADTNKRTGERNFETLVSLRPEVFS
jgi:hypothetical protein